MKMSILVLMPVLACSCATLNESMTLGAGLGALVGGASTYAAKATSGGAEVSAGDVALGAGIGILGGLLTSYFTHKSVEDTRAACMADQTEMQFGDLPPTPFIFPKTLPTKAGRR
jgi:hypothetical protein